MSRSLTGRIYLATSNGNFQTADDVKRSLAFLTFDIVLERCLFEGIFDVLHCRVKFLNVYFVDYPGDNAGICCEERGCGTAIGATGASRRLCPHSHSHSHAAVLE